MSGILNMMSSRIKLFMPWFYLDDLIKITKLWHNIQPRFKLTLSKKSRLKRERKMKKKRK